MRRRVGTLAAALAAAVACTAPAASAPRSPTPAPTPSGAQPVYVAIGASETVGIGTQDPARESWPQQLYQRLPATTVYYNFGIPSETTAAAMRDEVPPALAVQPTLVTVWLNVDDLVAGVSPADYEAQLDGLVAAVRRGGAARVLVANTPRLDRLPAYAACRPSPPPGSPRCPLNGIVLPPADQLDALIQAYNAAIARVVQRQGAVLVDLYGAGAVSDQHPEYVSADGFHPSAQGAAAIAGAFAGALGPA
jgi:acyl-CoA thioesterase I